MKMSKLVFLLAQFIFISSSFGQSFFTNSSVEFILLGDYSPSVYYDDLTTTSKGVVKSRIMNEISSDNLKSYLFEMNQFTTRNTGSDTLGDSGIGAAAWRVAQGLLSIISGDAADPRKSS